jgi:SAM-dependent methyltransferase
MSAPTPVVQRPPLIRELFQGKFDFLDLGCSRGGSLALAKKLFDAGRGLGLDIDEKKVTEAVAAGHAAVAFDIHKLPARPLVRFAIMLHFLEHVPDRRDVTAFIRKAVMISKEFVFIRQPYFDADGYLFKKGFKLYWSDWHGHPNPMSVLSFYSILMRMREAGRIGDFSIHLSGPIPDSSHPAVHPLGSPHSQHEYDPASHPSKSSTVGFDGEVYEETVVMITKPGVEHFAPFARISFDRTVFDTSRHTPTSGGT